MPTHFPSPLTHAANTDEQDFYEDASGPFRHMDPTQALKQMFSAFCDPEEENPYMSKAQFRKVMTTMGIKLTENEYKQLEADVASGDKVYINDLFNQPFLKKITTLES